MPDSEKDIYTPENLRPLFAFFHPLVNEATGETYEATQMRFVYDNGENVPHPDAED